MATPAEKQAYRVKKTFERHFERNKREVLVYGNPRKSDCTCAVAGPLDGSIDGNCEACGGKGYIYSDSSVCLYAIVALAEPRKGIATSVVDHEEPGSFHHQTYILVFKLEDVIMDPIGKPNLALFEQTGYTKIAWGGTIYLVESFARDGLGAEDMFFKVLVNRSD